MGGEMHSDLTCQYDAMVDREGSERLLGGGSWVERRAAPGHPHYRALRLVFRGLLREAWPDARALRRRECTVRGTCGAGRDR